jgi:F420-non-reducing hydrogenase iron-sulfur subunit
VDIVIFACQNRIPQDWRPPFTPDSINGQYIRLRQLPCSAKLTTLSIIRLFEKQADAVLVLACPENGCRSLEGSRRAAARVREANAVLEEVGLGNCRVMIRQSGANNRQDLLDALQELSGRVEKLGPNPAKGNRVR